MDMETLYNYIVSFIDKDIVAHSILILSFLTVGLLIGNYRLFKRIRNSIEAIDDIVSVIDKDIKTVVGVLTGLSAITESNSETLKDMNATLKNIKDTLTLHEIILSTNHKYNLVLLNEIKELKKRIDSLEKKMHNATK